MKIELSVELRRAHWILQFRPKHWELGKVKLAGARAYVFGPFMLEWYSR